MGKPPARKEDAEALAQIMRLTVALHGEDFDDLADFLDESPVAITQALASVNVPEDWLEQVQTFLMSPLIG